MKVGDAPISYQNNSFFVLLLISLFFGLELRFKPYGIPELNSLNFVANLVMMITIFGGLISSINQQTNLSFILMIVIMGLNFYFILLFLKCFIQIKMHFGQNFYFLNKLFDKLWASG